MIADEELVICE